MRTIDFVTKESRRRARRSIAGILFILLGIGIFVAAQTINKALQDKTKEQLIRFGANIMVQPKGEPFDQYSGTVEGEVLLPEDYVEKIQGIEHEEMLVAVSPKLFERFEVEGRSLLVVGITPDERKAKPWWMMEKDVVVDEFPRDKEILLGHHAATRLGEGISQIKLGNETFEVSGVLDETGSSDDFNAFVPLATLQGLVQKTGMVNLIEVSTSCIACEEMDVNGVTEEINEALPPDTEATAVKQIAEAQMGTLNKIMKFTMIIYIVVLGFCAILLMNYMSGAIRERQREIGMLLAMGMDPRKIQVIFISKILILAGIGGLLGYAVGTGISVLLGPLIADTSVTPIYYLLPISFAIALGLGIVSSIIPVKRISKLDPVEALREL